MKNRLILIFFVFLIVSSVVFVRIFRLQLLNDEKLENLSRSQFSRNIAVRTKRGLIYDRFGEELAISVESASVYVHPPLIKNKKRTAFVLSKALGLNVDDVYRKLSQKKPFVWIVRQFPKELGQKVKKEKLVGVGVFPEPQRRYPNNGLAAQVLGFVGIDGQGLEGLELAYDKFLKGERRYFQGLTDAYGRPVTSAYRKSLRESESSLILTLDKSLQYLAEKEIENAVKEFQAERGSVIILEPHTGEIIALAHYPSFNPNYFSKTSHDLWRNRAFADIFEPGSTFKTFLMAAALDEGLVKPHDQFYCEDGSFKVLNRTIGEAQNHKWKWLTAEDILKHSSNIGATKVAFHVGSEKYFKKITEFGFGFKTGIHFQGESSGLVRPLNEWTQIDLATAAFGQGISVSALQLVTAFSAIAHEGVLMEPYLVKEITNRKGERIYEAKPKEKARVISFETAETLKKMLVRVTSQDGTGYKASLPYFHIAGKTGTAQKPSVSGKGYSNDYVSSFIGFFPSDNPMYTMLVVVDSPKKEHYSSRVAAPVFKKITESIVRLYSKKFQTYVLAGTLQGPQPKNDQYDKLIRKALQEIDWKISKSHNKLTVPNFQGLTLREVLKLSKDAPVVMNVQGYGKVVTQYPKPGTEVSIGSALKILLKPDS